MVGVRWLGSGCGDASGRRWRSGPLVISFAVTVTAASPSFATSDQGAVGGKVRNFQWTAAAVETPAAEPVDRGRTAAAEAYLRHAYTVYFGLRACSEMSFERHDASFMPSVPIEAARRSLKSIDAAAAEVSIDANAAWSAAAPRASITAEALKADPEAHLEHCQKMGSLFRVDIGNLQPLLQSLGAKTVILTKDY